MENDTAGDGGLQRSGIPFTSDALWSPRSPRCIDAAHGWRTTPPGTAVSSVPASRSLQMRYGARGLRGVLMRRMDGEQHRRGRRAPRSGIPFASDAHWEPRSPRVFGERMTRRTFRRGRRAPRSGIPFTSDAHWEPRSPRCIDAAHGWRTTPPGTAVSTFRHPVLFRCALGTAVSAGIWRAHDEENVPPGTAVSSVPAFPFALLRPYRQPQQQAPAQARGTVSRPRPRPRPRSPVLPCLPVAGAPYTTHHPDV
jgi:hypothetical protein